MLTGNASLPIRAARIANLEIGVPGKRKRRTGSRFYGDVVVSDGAAFATDRFDVHDFKAAVI